MASAYASIYMARTLYGFSLRVRLMAERSSAALRWQRGLEQLVRALRCSPRGTRLEGPVRDHDRRGDGRRPTILEFLTREIPPAPLRVLAQAARPLLVLADVISEDLNKLGRHSAALVDLGG